MTTAPPSAGSSSPNTCEKLVCNRSPKSMAEDWIMGRDDGVLNDNCHLQALLYLVLTYSTAFLVSRPASPIEDHRPLAGRAHQPLPAPSVAQPERSAPDGARRHDRAVARAHWLLPRGHRIADRLLLSGLELRVLAAHDAIRMTSFPNCSPLASRSNA